MNTGHLSHLCSTWFMTYLYSMPSKGSCHAYRHTLDAWQGSPCEVLVVLRVGDLDLTYSLMTWYRGYPFNRNTLYEYLRPLCFVVSELQCVSTLPQSVQMHDFLFLMLWLLSEASILSVIFDFLLTLFASRPESACVTQSSTKQMR